MDTLTTLLKTVEHLANIGMGVYGIYSTRIYLEARLARHGAEPIIMVAQPSKES